MSNTSNMSNKIMSNMSTSNVNVNVNVKYVKQNKNFDFYNIPTTIFRISFFN